MSTTHRIGPVELRALVGEYRAEHRAIRAMWARHRAAGRDVPTRATTAAVARRHARAAAMVDRLILDDRFELAAALASESKWRVMGNIGKFPPIRSPWCLDGIRRTGAAVRAILATV